MESLQDKNISFVRRKLEGILARVTNFKIRIDEKVKEMHAAIDRASDSAKQHLETIQSEIEILAEKASRTRRPDFSEPLSFYECNLVGLIEENLPWDFIDLNFDDGGFNSVLSTYFIISNRLDFMDKPFAKVEVGPSLSILAYFCNNCHHNLAQWPMECPYHRLCQDCKLKGCNLCDNLDSFRELRSESKYVVINKCDGCRVYNSLSQAKCSHFLCENCISGDCKACNEFTCAGCNGRHHVIDSIELPCTHMYKNLCLVDFLITSACSLKKDIACEICKHQIPSGIIDRIKGFFEDSKTLKMVKKSLKESNKLSNSQTKQRGNFFGLFRKRGKDDN